MGCDARDSAACIHDHVRPWLTDPRPSDGGYTALAPCHDDTARSLSVSLGKYQAVIWCCHACQDRLGVDLAQVRTRSALIRAGVPARCLAVPRILADSMMDRVRDILHSKDKHVDKVFQLAVLMECGGEMPSGSELDRVAEWADVSRRAAYRSRLASSDNL